MPWLETQKFYGMNSLVRSTQLPEGYCGESMNSDLGSSSQAGPMKGYAIYGNQANVSNRIVRKFSYRKGDSGEIQLQVRDNATNFIVEYLNESDTRNSPQGEWTILEAGLARTINLSDGTTAQAKVDFAAYNNTGTNQLVYGNQVQTMRIWNGAIGAIAATTATTITLVGSTTAAVRGFAASGSVIINGNTYAYTGISSNQLTGVTPTPVGEAIGSGVTQVVNTSTLTAGPVAGILLSTQSRLFCAGMTATPNQVTFSDVSLVSSFAGANPSNGGLEDFPQMNGEITALSYIDDWILVFSQKKIIAFKFQFPTATTRTTIRKDIADEGTASYKAVKKVGNQVLYITSTGGIKRIMQVSNENLFTIDDLTDAIRPTIKNFVWTDAVLEYSKRDKVIISAGRSDTTTNTNNIVVFIWISLSGYTERSSPYSPDAITLRYNLGLNDWYIDDACVWKQEVHFGASAGSQSYRMFDGYSKAGASMIWRRVERTNWFGWKKQWIKYLAIRGAIGSSTTLVSTIKYGLNGSVTAIPCNLIGTDAQWVIQTPLNVLGGFPLGTEPLGGTIEDIGELNPFTVIYELPYIPIRDIQVEFNTDGIGQRVAIDGYALYVEETDEEDVNAIELRKTSL